MKVAVQIFGHLRTFELCYNSLFENLINLYDCDIFIHTWDTIDHSTKTWHNYKIIQEYTRDELENKINALYSPKKYIIEHQNVIDNGCIIAQGKNISIFGIQSMLQSMKEVNTLRESYEKENNIKYDYIVMIRPDIQLWLPFSIDSFIEFTDKNDVNNSFYFGGFYKFKEILNDWRVIGGSDVLFFSKSDIMSKIFNNIDMIKIICTTQSIAQYGPEYAFLYALNILNIKLQFINYLWGEKYTVLRNESVKSTSVISCQSKEKPWWRKIIRIHIRKNKFDLFFFTMLKYNIIEFKIVHKFFKIHFSLGKTDII